MDPSLWLAGLSAFVHSTEWLLSLEALYCVVAHVVAYAVLLQIALKPNFQDKLSSIAVLGCCGFVLFGYQLWAMGYASCWNPTALFVTTTACTLFLLWKFVVRRITHPALERSPDQETRTQDSRTVLRLGLSFLIAAMAALIVIAAIKPPYVTDETGYHWAAPLIWSKVGHWVPVPYRYMNGACLTELLYLVSAIFHAPTAAHWTHSLFLALLIAACMSLTRFCGGSAVVAGAACLASPVLVNESAWAYSDISVAAVAIAGLVSILRQKSGNKTAVIVLTAICASGVTSIKPALAFATAVSYFFAFQFVLSPHNRKTAALMTAIIISVVACTFGLWTLQTKHLTGKIFDSNCVVFLPANEHLAEHQEAIAKIPSLSSIAALPLLPIITPVIGQQEPYGSRTGFIGAVFTILLLIFWNKLSQEESRRCRVLFCTMLTYFFLVGIFTVRVRYLNYFWSLLICVAAVVPSVMNKTSTPTKLRVAIPALFCLLVIAGMVDCAHVLLHWPGPELAQLMPHFKSVE